MIENKGMVIVRFGDPLETQKRRVEDMPTNLGSCRTLGELRCRDGKSNRRSTRRPVSALKKYALAGASRRSRTAATLRLEIVEITSPISFRPETSSSPRL